MPLQRLFIAYNKLHPSPLMESQDLSGLHRGIVDSREKCKSRSMLDIDTLSRPRSPDSRIIARQVSHCLELIRTSSGILVIFLLQSLKILRVPIATTRPISLSIFPQSLQIALRNGLFGYASFKAIRGSVVCCSAIPKKAWRASTRTVTVVRVARSHRLVQQHYHDAVHPRGKCDHCLYTSIRYIPDDRPSGGY